MTTQDDANRSNALTISRQEKLQSLRDDLAPGERPSPIVPRTFAEVYTMCEALTKADLAPKHLRGKAMDMALVVMTGLEVGLPPMASLRLYTTWDGVPRLMAEGVRAIILQSPAIEYFEVATCDDTHATWVGKRRGRPEKSTTWTIERAKKAGLLGKENWSKYPQDMLNARASMQLGRLIAPDVVSGMVSREEANDGDFIDAQSVEQPKFSAPPQVVEQIARGRVVEVTSAAPAPAPEPTAASGPLRAARRVAKVEEKAERPTPAASTNSTSPAASSPAASPDDPFEGALAVETRDRWGQPIGDPTSGGGTSDPRSSGAPTSETPSAASTKPTEDFGTESPPADEAMAKILEFEEWLQSCPSQREMAANFPKWAAWSREMAKAGDARFSTAGELAIRMKDSWGRRKAQVPS